jgi:prolyl 4-hydroxylase
MDDLADLKQRARTSGAAAMDLAERQLLGIGMKPDQKAAFATVQQAVRLGHDDGRRAWFYLTAAGIGTNPDPAAARKMLAERAKEDRFAAVQLAFLDHVTCEQRLAQVKPRVISADPYIALYPGLFSPAECRYLMTLGTPWMERAKVIDEETGEGRLDAIRDADASSFPHLAEDLVVQAINRCIAKATGTEPGWGEPMSILRYAPGQQYHVHHDAQGARDPIALRRFTALIWLNGEFEGGETHFPDVKVTVRGDVGDMLVFGNVTADGHPDERMRHAGLPVASGVKWLASRWIRSTPYLK